MCSVCLSHFCFKMQIVETVNAGAKVGELTDRMLMRLGHPSLNSDKMLIVISDAFFRGVPIVLQKTDCLAGLRF